MGRKHGTKRADGIRKRKKKGFNQKCMKLVFVASLCQTLLLPLLLLQLGDFDNANLPNYTFPQAPWGEGMLTLFQFQQELQERENAPLLPPRVQNLTCPDRREDDHRLAFIIPFRDASEDTRSQGSDRETNLEDWLQYMRIALPPNLLNHSHVFIAEQTQEGVFNKGVLFNSAFDYIFERKHPCQFDYIVLHDVDQIPTVATAQFVYEYKTRPTKLIKETTRKASRDDTEHARVLFKDNVGGALVMTDKDYRKINGYSNLFKGWGGEDVNMANRIKKFIKIKHDILEAGKFREIYHERVIGLDEGDIFRDNSKRIKSDFQSGLANLNYTLHSAAFRQVERWNVTRLLIHPYV